MQKSYISSISNIWLDIENARQSKKWSHQLDHCSDELQKVIGDTKSADGINERWNEVLERLDQLSTEYAKELQSETGGRYEKDKELYSIWQFPPYRLLAMNLILSRWVGWQSVPENLHLVSEWRRIETAYDKGRNSYMEYAKDQDA